MFQAGGQRHRPDVARVQAELGADYKQQYHEFDLRQHIDLVMHLHHADPGQPGDQRQQRDLGARPFLRWHSGRTSRVQGDGKVVLRIQGDQLPSHIIETRDGRSERRQPIAST